MLPNFCRGRGDPSRNNFDRNVDNLKKAEDIIVSFQIPYNKERY